MKTPIFPITIFTLLFAIVLPSPGWSASGTAESPQIENEAIKKIRDDLTSLKGSIENQQSALSSASLEITKLKTQADVFRQQLELLDKLRQGLARLEDESQSLPKQTATATKELEGTQRLIANLGTMLEVYSKARSNRSAQ
ncbi:MAG: hypothetical protein HQL51_12540 [Magnetococcales bacterium]|nr:hypothetical protein [Magnetococcales bacterium]